MAKPGQQIGHAFGGEFIALEPKPYPNENLGTKTYGGPTLDYIRVTNGKKYAHSPLEDKVERLIASSWQFAQPAEGATRGSVSMGGHRNMPAPPSRPVPARPGAAPHMGGHRGMPQMPPLPAIPARPSVQTFHSAAPIGFSNQQKTMSPHLKNVVPMDWDVMKTIPRVTAYTFRGDKRPPDAIRQADGFQPSFSRTDAGYIDAVVYPIFKTYINTKLQVDLTLDQFKRLMNETMPSQQDQLLFTYYTMWRSQVAREAMHLGRMIAREDLKGYVSTTKAVDVAKGYAGATGYVYLTFVETGFHVPAKGTHAWSGMFAEEEIASPFPIKWSSILGFRATKMGPIGGNLFTGPVFVRANMPSVDKKAFQTIFSLLSGKPQY